MRISDWSSDVCSSDLSQPESRKSIMKLMARLTAIEVGSMPTTMAFAPALAACPAVAPALNAVYAAFIPVNTPLATAIFVPTDEKIGSASWWERVCQYVYISVVAVYLKTKQQRR